MGWSTEKSEVFQRYERFHLRDLLEIVLLVEVCERMVDDPMLTFIQANSFDHVQQLGIFW
jgi:hypothetical protein